MTSGNPEYRMVIFEALDDPKGVRDLFCKVLGMHPTDATQWLARLPGVWPRPLAEPETRQLLDGLYEFGVAAEAWRVDQFPDVLPPRTIHTAACLPEGFRIQGLHGEPTHWVPWDRFELICAGRIATEDEFRGAAPPNWTSTLTMGLQAITLRRPKLAPRTSRASRIPRDPVAEVIIIRRDPRIAFRIVENQMSYAYLGERLCASASENFPIFLADLCARADQAYLPESTRAILKLGEPGEYLFPSSQAIQEYAVNRLLWSWYRRDRDAQRGTSF
ncbi:hypothetical protein [Singulisphaera sp. PoT]|uniref:hypothetical protein n=1 Tax=Singulisphaera sp. PoT TaxID=3411797 RepID=UPI003BF4AD77